MQIPKISNQVSFSARKQKAKTKNPQSSVVSDGYLKSQNSNSFQSIYYSTRPDLSRNYWNLPFKNSENRLALDEEKLGMPYEEAQETLGSMTLGALSQQQKRLEKISLQGTDGDFQDRHFEEKKLEKLRAKIQGYILKDAIYDYTKAQTQANKFQRTFSGHELDLNKIYMLDAALNAKKRGKEESAPVKIGGKTYFSSLRTVKVQKGEKQENVDLLTIRCPQDRITATFKQREFKNDLDFLADPENYQDFLRPEFNLIELKEGSDIILLNSATQAVEGLFKNCTFNKNGEGRCEKFIKLKTTGEDKNKKGFFVLEDCSLLGNKVQKYKAKYRYALKNGCVVSIEKAGLRTKDGKPCHYVLQKGEGWMEVLNNQPA